MALPIRDGNQSPTTLSTIIVNNAHIPAHTVASLGSQAVTDIATAVSGVELGPNTLNALENITVTLGQVTITGGLTDAQLRASAVTIGGIVTATISGTASVTFGTAVVTGSASILNFPATQTVTFGQASVTFGTAVITGSTSILNFPATQTVTFTQASVTFGVPTITGSVSVLNLPATQTVTFSQASVTFGLISGTITVGSLPAIPAGTNQIGSVTASGTVTANIGGIANSVTLPVRLNAEKYGEAPSGQDTLIVCNASGMLLVDANSGGSSVLGFDGNAFVQVKQVSGSSVTIGNTVTVSISGTPSVTFGTAVITGSTSIIGTPSITFGLISGTVTATPTGTQTIAGTVTANLALVGGLPNAVQLVSYDDDALDYFAVAINTPEGPYIPTRIVGGSVTIGSALPTGTNNIGVVTVGNTITIANIQGTTVTTSNFTSTTPSTVLAGFNANREVLTIFNEGAGNLHISAGATCTTIGYQVRLSAGDYYEVPLNQASITHSAVFATAGTARVTQVS